MGIKMSSVHMALMEFKVCVSGIFLVQKWEGKKNMEISKKILPFSEFEAQTIQKYVILGKIKIDCHHF